MDILILAEKREQGEKIAVGMGLPGQGKPFIYGDYAGKSICVAWAAGHLAEPSPPEKMKPDANWFDPKSLLPLPVPGKMQLSERGSKLMGNLKPVIEKAGQVWIATDPDREGEAIGRNILAYARYKGPMKRLWLAGSLEPKDIQKAVTALKDASSTVQFWRAQQARQGADWLWQFLVRGYTMQAKAGLMGEHLGKGSGPAGVVSVGRVQTATLKMVVDRDAAIANFKPIDHFMVSPIIAGHPWAYAIPADVPPGPGRAFDDDGKVYFVSEEMANRFADRLQGKPIQVTKADLGKRKSNPPLPHSLTTLQRIMSKKHGLSATQTLKMADEIRMDGYLTYPRTEHGEIPLSLYNAEDLTAQLSACAAVPDLRQPAQNMMQAHPGERPPSCYTTKPMEHHGIIPTGKVPDLNTWPAKKADLFRECAKAFVIALHPAATFNTLKVEGIVHVEGMAEETPSAFKKGFEQLVNAGWLEVAGGEIPSRDPIPSILAGSSILVQSVEVSAKRTNPPKPFTEDTLLAAMLNAGREAGDGDDAKMLRKVSGIGTPATRAAILETLQTREYLALTKGKGGAVFKSTIKGQELIRHAPSDLANVSITAQLERDLQDIDQAASDSDACRLRDEFVGRQIGFVTNHISTIINTMESAPPGNENRFGGSGKPTAKMIEYVRSIGKRVGVDTADAETSFEAAKRFIDQHKDKNNPPTAKMIGFAEKLAKENGVEVSDDVRSSFVSCKAFIDELIKMKEQ